MKEEEKDILIQLAGILNRIISGEKLKKIEPGEIRVTENPELKKLVETAVTLYNDFASGQEFINELSRGNLQAASPRNMLIISPYKQLQSELRHLRWQIKQIAEGDLEQEVVFFGDFSEVMNKMIASLRERQRLSNELKEANATKNKLFSIIAHDLRNPLNAIIGLSNAMTENMDSLEKEEIKTYAEMINQSANDTYELLVNLLEWSRIQTGRITTDFQEIVLADILISNIRIANVTAEPKNINITVNKKLQDREILLTDFHLLNTIIRNILENAVKYTPEGGEINIAVEKKNNSCHIVIKDTGIGMSNEQCKSLFILSNKKSTPGTNNEKGTGLGLIISKDFAKMLGGNITVESTQGEGTTFTIALPYEQKFAEVPRVML